MASDDENDKDGDCLPVVIGPKFPWSGRLDCLPSVFCGMRVTFDVRLGGALIRSAVVDCDTEADSREALPVASLDRCRGKWLEQTTNLAEAWPFHRVGYEQCSYTP